MKNDKVQVKIDIIDMVQEEIVFIVSLEMFLCFL